MPILQADRSILNAELAEWCRGQVGVHWEHQGRKPGMGLDCVGMPVCAVSVRGLPIIDMRNYSEMPTPAQLLELVAKNCKAAPTPAAGLLVLFWIGRKEHGPTHAGVMLNEREFVHARRGRGDGRVEVVEFSRWANRVHSFWEYDLAWRASAHG